MIHAKFLIRIDYDDGEYYDDDDGEYDDDGE